MEFYKIIKTIKRWNNNRYNIILANIPGSGIYGIAANPDLLQLSKNHLGNIPNTWGYSAGNGFLHNFLAGNGPYQCLPYGPILMSGDIFT
jgi:hypothetical protein